MSAFDPLRTLATVMPQPDYAVRQGIYLAIFVYDPSRRTPQIPNFVSAVSKTSAPPFAFVALQSQPSRFIRLARQRRAIFVREESF